MLLETGQVKSKIGVDDDLFEYLRHSLDEVCCEIAEKYGLYDSHARPRKAFVLDTLMKYSCYGCINKVFTQQRKTDGIDKLFLQNHKLAVNLLVEQLRHRFKATGFKPKVEEEVRGEYGRVDIIVKPTSTGVIVEIGNTIEIIIEVKTGASFTYAQLFRYLLERPNAVLVLWRVTQRQIIVIDGGKIRGLLLMVMEAALNRGTVILNGEYEECSHNPVRNEPYVIEDAQAIVDDFLTAIVDTLPVIIESVLNAIRNCLAATEAVDSLSAVRSGGGHVEV